MRRVLKQKVHKIVIFERSLTQFSEWKSWEAALFDLKFRFLSRKQNFQKSNNHFAINYREMIFEIVNNNKKVGN